MYNKVMKYIKEWEEKVMFDVECYYHYYSINFENNKLIISEIDEYQYDGDEWGEIITKTNVCKFKEIECSLEKFSKFLVRFYNAKISYIKYKYPENNGIIKKIDIIYY